MTAAYTGGFTVKLSNGASPEVYTSIEEVRNMSGFGKTNPLIDATSHDSTAREYIAGLPDGSEITLECLMIMASPSGQNKLSAIVDSKTNRNMQIVLTDGTTTFTYTFTIVPLSWSPAPSYDDATMMAFTAKISGAISLVVS